VGVLAKPLMWDWPADTKKLTPDERMLLKSRMDKDTEMAKMDRLDKKAMKRIITDWKIYTGSIEPFFGVR
jgi:hypothetical protein